MIEIRQGGDEQLDEFVELLEQAGSWLWSRGIAQWPPGSSRPQRPMLAALQAAGVLALGYANSRLAGGCIVTPIATPEWRGREGEAATLHKLVVDRAFAGRGLGARLVGWAEAWTRERGLLRLRLDCWDGNATLREFYRGLGFRELDAVESHGAQVRLFEKYLGAAES